MSEVSNERSALLAGMHLLLSGKDGAASCRPDAVLISVIMPVFNRREMMAEALESLLKQTWARFEAIVVSDYCTDGTCEIVAQYAARDPRVRLIKNERRLGAAASRNLGLAKASGDIITYLDSDNLLYPHALATIADAFTSPDVWSVFTAHLWQGPNGSLDLRCPDATLAEMISGDAVYDLNAFAHRRALYDALGGFDENLNRFIDWELELRFAKVVMAHRVPVPTGLYRNGTWPRITNESSDGWNRRLVTQQSPLKLAHALKVLYIVHSYPQVSETYIVSEYRFMRSRGVNVELWSETDAEVPDTDLLDPSIIKVHRGPLAEAIQAFKPDLLHMHWMNAFYRHDDTIAASGLPVTIRGHSFDFSADLLTRLQTHPSVRSVYVFPTQGGFLPAEQGRLKAVPVGFDPNQYYPAAAKDRRLVVRTGVALPTKDVKSFIHVAARCPEHQFVLMGCRVLGNPGYLDTILEENIKLGSPVEIHIDRPASEVAGWMHRAGIMLHAFDPAIARFGMPISISEAMATGAYVLARESAAGASYLGSENRLYGSVDQAAEKIRATLDWDDARWEEERKLSISHAFLNFDPSRSTRLILEDWSNLTGMGYLMPRSSQTLMTLAPGELVSFASGSKGGGMLRAGFHDPEDLGAWSGQANSSVAFVATSGDWARVKALEIEARCFGRGVPLTVVLNGTEVGRTKVEVKEGRYRIPLDLSIEAGSVVNLEFKSIDPLTPRDFGSADSRYIGFGLMGLRFAVDD